MELMPTITVYLPDEVYEKWRNDEKRKEAKRRNVRYNFASKLIAAHYGLIINESRVVVKEGA